MTTTASYTRPLVMAGAGGHARVLLALAQAAGLDVVAICDPRLASEGTTEWQGLPVWGDDAALATIDPAEYALVNAIGQLPHSTARREVYKRIRGLELSLPSLVHPCAWVAPGVVLDGGTQVMAGATLQPGCRIGENSIINTHASIDHDGRIGAHVHVAPGAVLCGGVTLGEGAFVGAGATILPNVTVGAGAIVGAGTCLRQDLAPESLYAGHGKTLPASRKPKLS